jgi:TorA maturation chaperone TorD
VSALQCGADKAFEDQLRAGTYSLLAELLAAPPDEVMLQRLQAIGDGESPDNRDHMAQAWSALKRAAEQAKPECLKAEFYTLFIGLGRGELVPYGSWYLTGFLMEKPLGDLRRNLEALG